MLNVPFHRFRNPYRKLMSQVWEGRMLEGKVYRFRNPCRKPMSQVWEGRMLDGVICRFRNPYRKSWSQVWKCGIPIDNLGLRSGKLGCWEVGGLEGCYVGRLVG